MIDERLPALRIWHLACCWPTPCECRFTIPDGVSFLGKGT